MRYTDNCAFYKPRLARLAKSNRTTIGNWACRLSLTDESGVAQQAISILVYTTFPFNCMDLSLSEKGGP